jgi:signal transduction histidine kinase
MLASPISLFWPYPARSSRAGWIAVVVTLVAAIASIDYATGYHINLPVLYMVPIFLATWMIGRMAGVLTVCLAVGLWGAVFAPHHLMFPFLFAWKALVQFLVYIVFVVVLDLLKMALSHADERFAAVLEGLDALIYVIEPGNGRVLYVNNRGRDAFGGAPHNAREIGRRLGMPLAVDAGTPPVEIQDAVSGRWLMLATQAIRWVDGRIVQLHVATDVTALKQAEETARLQHEKIEMSQRLVTAGEMASLLAHELNQPLAAISNYNTGCVNRLRSGNWQEKEILEALEKSVVQARRAGGVLQRVREFLRRREADLAPCDLAAIIADVSSMVGPDAKRNAVNLRCSLDRGLPAAHVDSVLIKQVLLNLIRNGIESLHGMPEARRELSVRLSADSRDILRVDVADRGCGLPAALAGDAVKPFFTTKSYGMGLGLQICRSIVELHGGRLWATSNPEGGTVFHFTVAAARP